MFFSQVIELYKSLKYATVELDAGLRQDIASYIIPEIEELMSSVTNFGLGIQDFHQKVISSLAALSTMLTVQLLRQLTPIPPETVRGGSQDQDGP